MLGGNPIPTDLVMDLPACTETPRRKRGQPSLRLALQRQRVR